MPCCNLCVCRLAQFCGNCLPNVRPLHTPVRSHAADMIKRPCHQAYLGSGFDMSRVPHEELGIVCRASVPTPGCRLHHACRLHLARALHRPWVLYFSCMHANGAPALASDEHDMVPSYVVFDATEDGSIAASHHSALLVSKVLPVISVTCFHQSAPHPAQVPIN